MLADMEHTEEPPPTLVRRLDAIKMTGLPESTFDRWVREGHIQRPAAQTVPGSWFERAEIERVIELIGRRTDG